MEEKNKVEEPNENEENKDITVQTLVDEIKSLNEALKSQNEAHKKEIEEIVKNFSHNKEPQKSEEEIMIENVINKVNKYRG